MGNTITTETIISRLTDGYYRAKYTKPPAILQPGHIEDENQTVVWNRNFVKEQNEKRSHIIQTNRENENAVARQFTKDLEDAVANEYGCNPKQAGLIVSESYEHGHGSGYSEVVYWAREYASFWQDMKAAE